MKRTLAAAAALAAALTLGACSSTDPTDTQTNPEPADEQSDPWGPGPAQVDGETPEPEPTLPEPDDFELDVTVLSEQCFGSAGCSVTYRVTPTIVDAVHDDVTATIVYEVAGGDNTVTNSFDLLGGGEYQYQPEEMVDTPSEGVELTATVTDVLRN